MEHQTSGSSSSRWSRIYKTDSSLDEIPIWKSPSVKKKSTTASLLSTRENTVQSVENELEESEEFYVSLAEAVRPHPCLYAPADKCYRTNEKYRDECWAQVAIRINYRGDIAPLAKQWVALRERYREWCGDQLSNSDNMGDFPMLFASLNWLDHHVIPLYERIPLFATMVKIHNHIVTQKEKAEKRANSWKTAKKTNAVRTSTPKAQQQKDVYDISVDSTDTEENKKNEERQNKTPKTRINKRMMVPTSTPRRITRSYQPVVEHEYSE